MAKENSEFISAMYQIAEDRGLPTEVVRKRLEDAFLTAFKKTQNITDEKVINADGVEEDLISSAYSVEIDDDTNEIYVLADKKVVSVITDQNTQILESQAKLIDPRLREGDHIQIDVTPDNFGRIAAQAAYQRLMQGLRDAELESTIEKYHDKVGKIITGVIQRKDISFVRVEIDRAEAIMPVSESIPGEFYRSSERMRFLLVRLQNSATDKRMILSRGSADFLRAIFENEVPEVATGSVEIIDIAREPGSRSKVAVKSMHEKVDAIGACVGPRGTRIDAIMNEINPEKVDIILYDEEIKNYIINALSPAKVAGVKVNPEGNNAVVLVAEDMLSLAIGKDGQNVRLAAKLTGYKIDITSDASEFETSLEDLKNIDKAEVIDLKASKEIKSEKVKISKEFNIEELGLTGRQLKLLEAAKISTKEELEKVSKGELEVEGFSKRDITKIAGLI